MVEFEVADEHPVDEHGGVGVVDHEAGGFAGVVDADVDDPGSDPDEALAVNGHGGGALGGGQG